jgi:glycosyltransferase involved in cell wall biosynthesis
MKISYVSKGYPEARNIIYNRTISFVKEIDVFKAISVFFFKITGKVNYVLHNLHYQPFKKRNYHFFNVVSFSKRSSWINTFETFVPRLPNAPRFIVNFAVKKLASNSCKQIIALSQCTYDIQYDYLSKNYPSSLNVIMDKCMVVHPPQKLIINNLEDKLRYLKAVNVVVFTLVGSDFFRKGGMEVLTAFVRLKEKGITNWHLNIVSSLNYGDYATKTTVEDYNRAVAFIDKNSENITLFKKLPNAEVMELFKKSHIGLLPTWADTYGYSVLEAQACGCPVVTTDIRAMPEINNNDCGWIINVPKDNLGNGLLQNKQDRVRFSEIISEELFKIFVKTIESPESIDTKMEASIERINKEHSIEKHSALLESIYKKYLNK